jgi:predicted metal-dependent HD superfamily phosphohydrolase
MGPVMDRIAARAPPGLDPPPALWDEVAAAYASPGRHYHTLAHVAEVADRYAEVSAGPGWLDPIDVFVAILAHDAVYDPARFDNEQRSAELCRRWCETLLGRDPAKAERLVLATAGHGERPTADDPDLLHFLDCDLAILGADPEAYDAYEKGVAAEYGAVVPPELFREGRRRFLERMVAQPEIFHTRFFRERLEPQARANLAWALSKLA